MIKDAACYKNFVYELSVSGGTATQYLGLYLLIVTDANSLSRYIRLGSLIADRTRFQIRSKSDIIYNSRKFIFQFAQLIFII